GIREFIVGTGGTALRTRSIPAKHSQVFGAAHGVIKLTLHATSYDWAFIPIAGKTFTDHGSGSTHGPPPTRTRRSFAITTDAYVDQARPATRFGGSARLLVDGDTGAGLDRETYLKATVSGLTGRVDRAALRLWVTNPTIDGPTVAATSTGWTGATITWASRPSSTGSVVIDLDRVPSGTWVDVPVTPVVQDDGTFAFRLRPTSGDGLEASSLQGDHPPRLIVDTVPATP
ncbi:MAG TPA: DNRLRE domain-containing protein, partial [Candidatus Saccharimonadales bacterium]|nr:DNRLRE domain-containing protein [Candidatus Saccharimonadales bacterium]